MREAIDPEQTDLTSDRGSFCLTNLSSVYLVGAALAASGVLWLCIWAVL